MTRQELGARAGLAWRVVRAFLRKTPEAAHLEDDLRGVALLALVEHAPKWREGLAPFASFMWPWLMREVQRAWLMFGGPTRHTTRDATWPSLGVNIDDPEVLALVEGRSVSRSPEISVETRELVERLVAVESKLPARRAECFRLRFVEGRSIKETAEAMGVCTQAVDLHIAKIRRRLAEAA